MKYNVGDKVVIKSWNKLVEEFGEADEAGDITCTNESFVSYMKEYCGESVTIKKCFLNGYEIEGDKDAWKFTDEMIAGYDHDGCSGCTNIIVPSYEEPCCLCRLGNGECSSPDLFEPSIDFYEKAEVTAKEENNDPVNHPNHYCREGGVECKEEIKLILNQMFGPTGFSAWCMGNYLKYRYRAADKNGLEDLQKSDVNFKWLTEEMKGMNDNGN